MEQDPTYILRHPSLNQGNDGSSIITLNITPFAALMLPNGPKEFYTELLNDIGVTAEAKSWEILAYRSNYHGERDEPEQWRDLWVKNWRVAISLTSPISALPPLQDEYMETYAYAGEPRWHESKEELTIGCLIIADFRSKEAADEAEAAIDSSIEVQQLAEEISAPSPEFYSVEIGGMFYQLQIFLGHFSETFFENGAAYALAVENVCREVGGITSFDERADEWDEV